MNTATGEVVSMGAVEILKAEGNRTANFYKQIPDALLPEIHGMNRKQCREWYRKNKKRFTAIAKAEAQP